MKHHKKKVLQSLHMFVVSSHAIHFSCLSIWELWAIRTNLDFVQCAHIFYSHVLHIILYSCAIHASLNFMQYALILSLCNIHQFEFRAIHILFMCNMHHPLFVCNMHQCEFCARCTNLNFVQIRTHPLFTCKTYSLFFHEKDVSIQIPCNTHWYCIYVHTSLLSSSMHTSPCSHAMRINSIFMANKPYA